MNSRGRNLLFVLLLAAAGAGVLGVVSLLQQAPRGPAAGGEAGVQMEQATALDREVRALRDRDAVQDLEIAAQSNRADAAAAKLDEEKKTNGPLREQIEKSLAQEIAFRAELDRRESEIRMGQASYQKLSGELGDAKGENQRLAKLVQDLQAAQKVAAEVEAGLRGQLGGMEKRATDGEKLLETVRQVLKKAEDELAAEKATSARLTAEAVALRKTSDDLRKTIEELTAKLAQAQEAAAKAAAPPALAPVEPKPPAPAPAPAPAP